VLRWTDWWGETIGRVSAGGVFVGPRFRFKLGAFAVPGEDEAVLVVRAQDGPGR